MSKLSWRGSPPPTSATPRTDRATFGGDVADTARMLDVEFMGWQTLAADRGLEHDDGRPAHREVDVSIDRQTGKSTLILAVAVHRMLTRPGSWLTYTSASRLAARRKLLKVWWPLIRRSPLRDRFTVTKGTGSESLECVNGSVLLLLSGDEASGHGDSSIWRSWTRRGRSPRPASRRSARRWLPGRMGSCG
jgi:hypothetical protein